MPKTTVRTRAAPGSPKLNITSHGPSGYNKGCRCRICRAAHRERMQAGAAARKAVGLRPDDPRHGTVNGYVNWYCRCDACVAVGVPYVDEHRGEVGSRAKPATKRHVKLQKKREAPAPVAKAVKPTRSRRTSK